MFQEQIDQTLQDRLVKAEQKGRQSALFEVAKILSDKGCDIDMISQVTGLSIADIKQILD